MSFSTLIKSTKSPKRLAVKLNSKGEQFAVKGYPCVFLNSIFKIKDTANSDDLVFILGKNNYYEKSTKFILTKFYKY